MAAQHEGYWLPQTASENWCEPDYVYSPYVAEWFNTLSSLPLVIFSLISLCLGARHGYARRLMVPALLTLLVGCGSVAFHGTMRYGGQALDELSMVLAATAFLYCGLEADPRAIKMPWLAPVLLVWSASFVAAYAFLKNTGYFLFFVVIFTALSIRCCYTAYQMHLRTADKTLRTLFFAGQGLWAAGFILLWLPDKLLCAHVQHLNLHAIFHVMTAIATSWFHTHNVHCFYTALYAHNTGGLICAASGEATPAPPALMDFLQLDVAPEGDAAKGAQPPPLLPLVLRRPSLIYFGVIGPFVTLVEEKGAGKRT